MHDILIRNGLVIDGSGAPGVRADIAVDGNRIAAIAPGLPDDGFKMLDANGLVVAPGFIDIKTHSDFTIPINPKAESKVRQGVTTEIVGHCGFSVAPCLAEKVQLLRTISARPRRGCLFGRALSPSTWTPSRRLR